MPWTSNEVLHLPLGKKTQDTWVVTPRSSPKMKSEAIIRRGKQRCPLYTSPLSLLLRFVHQELKRVSI